MRNRARKQGALPSLPLSMLPRLFVLLPLAVLFCGCATEIAGKKQLVPDPVYTEMGNQLRDGILICDSEDLSIEIKYLAEAELLESLRARASNPSLFDPPPSWLEAMTPFLMAATNHSKVPVILEGQHALLWDNKGSKLYSLEYAELYQKLSGEEKGEEVMKVLGGLLFTFSPLVSGQSRQGLLLFGSLDPKAKKAGLKFSFLFGGKALKTQECVFPFVVEALSPAK